MDPEQEVPIVKPDYLAEATQYVKDNYRWVETSENLVSFIHFVDNTTDIILVSITTNGRYFTIDVNAYSRVSNSICNAIHNLRIVHKESAMKVVEQAFINEQINKLTNYKEMCKLQNQATSEALEALNQYAARNSYQHARPANFYNVTSHNTPIWDKFVDSIFSFWKK